MLKKRNYVYISVPLRNSNIINPIRFFVNLSEDIENNHLKAYYSFKSNFPDPKNEDCRWNSFPTKIAEDGQSFTVEFLVSDQVGEDGMVITDNWSEKTYTFENEITDWIYIEYVNSIGLLREKYSPKNNKQIQDNLSDLIPRLESSIKKIEESKIEQSSKLIYYRGLHGVIRYIHQHYKSLMPKSKNPLIDKILKERNIDDDSFELKKINPSIAEAIIAYNEGGGFNLAGDKIKESLESFVKKEFGLCKKITFQTNLSLASYLIARLTDYLNMTRTEVEIKNIFFFNENPFNQNACGKSVRTLKSKNPEAMKAIDMLIKEHLEN